MKTVETTSLLRCPACAHEAPLAMPTDACQFFHECTACGTLLRPKPGDCCVFCSYGSLPCPPVQVAGKAGAGCCGPRADALPPASTTESSRDTRTSVAAGWRFGWADTAGALGAAFAALCCMGMPVILAALGAAGLGWLRRDAILWPLMFVSLAVALWGLSRDRQRHRSAGPVAAALAGAIALVAGVVFVHGPSARMLIDAGAVALVAATIWNAALRRSCTRGLPAAGLDARTTLTSR